MTSFEDDPPPAGKTRLGRLDPALLALLDGSDPYLMPAQAMPLTTVGADGAPHIALVSCGEVLAVDDQTLRLALWSTSTTAANMSARPRATLAVVADGAFAGIDLDVARGADVGVWGQQLAVFHGRVASVALDRVPYAQVTSGITFRTVDDSVLNRWQSTLDLLRRAVPATPRPARTSNPDVGHPPG